MAPFLANGLPRLRNCPMFVVDVYRQSCPLKYRAQGIVHQVAHSYAHQVAHSHFVEAL